MSGSPSDSCWITRKPEATLALASALAGCIGPRGLVIALSGDLGCGKTVFAKGLAAGLGIDPEAVASPTFTIAGEYPTAAGGRYAHADLYRIESEGELRAAGFDDLLEPGTILAVEWAERFPEALPADRLVLTLVRGLAGDGEFGEDSAAAEPGAAGGRRIAARAGGPKAEAVLALWAEAADGLGGVERAEPRGV